MKQTVSFYDFERAFEEANRGNQFTYEGREALFEYLKEYEDSTGEEIELDVIALCCEYVEYENIAEYLECYDTIIKKTDFIFDETIGVNEAEFNKAVKEEIQGKTTLIEIDDDYGDSFIIGQY